MPKQPREARLMGYLEQTPLARAGSPNSSLSSPPPDQLPQKPSLSARVPSPHHDRWTSTNRHRLLPYLGKVSMNTCWEPTSCQHGPWAWLALASEDGLGPRAAGTSKQTIRVQSHFTPAPLLSRLAPVSSEPPASPSPGDPSPALLIHNQSSDSLRVSEEVEMGGRDTGDSGKGEGGTGGGSTRRPRWQGGHAVRTARWWALREAMETHFLSTPRGSIFSFSKQCSYLN